jgi:integrase
MSRIARSYHIYRRTDTKKYQLTLYPVSGLPASVCAQWVAKSYANLPPELAQYRAAHQSGGGVGRDAAYRLSQAGELANLPPELAQYREPRTKAAAQAGAMLLIDYLKRGLLPAPINEGKQSGTGFVEYLLAFWSADTPYARKKAKVDAEPLSAVYIKANHHDIETHVATCPDFRGLSLGALTAGAIEDWKLWAMETRGLSGRRVNAIISAMRVPVRYAISRQELTINPFASVDKARERLQERGILTPAEVKALASTPVKNERDRLVVLLAALCGMRRGAVRGLRWGDIGDGVISIRHNYVNAEGDKRPKRGSERVVPMPRSIADTLNRLYGVGKAGTEFVFERGLSGLPVGETWFKGAFRRELAGIGIDATQIKARHLVYHGLRYTYITLSRMAGISDLEIQALAGHKSGRMMERYTHTIQVLDYDGARGKLDKMIE